MEGVMFRRIERIMFVLGHSVYLVTG